MTPQLFPDLQQQNPYKHVVTIGNFDGVHRGHQYLLNLVISEATTRGVRSAVVTFDPLPLEVLRPDASLPRLTSSEDRFALMYGLGIDTVVPIRFSADVAALEATEFVDQLVNALRPVEIIVGSDFAFGHNRGGNVQLLRQLGERYGFTVRATDRVGDDHQDFSSSRVRSRLTDGDVRHAADVLGHPYFVRGIVQEGKRRGRELGFPTANLSLLGNVAVPANGIYASMTQVVDGGELIPSMVYVGTNPTFDDGPRVVEVNLLNFNRDLYGVELTVLFIERVRGDQRFDSAQDLIVQMHHDQVVTETVLGRLPNDWPGDAIRAILGMGKGALTGDR